MVRAHPGGGLHAEAPGEAGANDADVDPFDGPAYPEELGEGPDVAFRR